jgi:peptidoglycan hydrolase-like protein with peptidoglycan-binding domain
MATAQQINTFIGEISPLIQKYAKLYGYKVASPIIAQACIESAYGTSSLGYKYHNYFGMKCGSSWKGKSVNLTTKEEYTVGNYTTIKDNFRVYDSMEEGVKGYFNFISGSRYANLKSATTAKQYLEFIKADGYATSSTYVNTNMNVVNKYNLIQFDICLLQALKDITTEYNPFVEPMLSITLGSKGDGAKWVQWYLWIFDLIEKSGIDGIIGNKSVAAIKEAQTRLGLKADGIVGKNTREKFKETLQGR